MPRRKSSGGVRWRSLDEAGTNRFGPRDMSDGRDKVVVAGHRDLVSRSLCAITLSFVVGVLSLF